ncbi:hypothetical protein [Mesorhizobium sp. 1M-11]|uniref:hypothetical protein n=1 Tax=Mesorhizobium sp. 1M-11 TaxID=1529006 RepID=UPI00128F998A|nr:hypothetical protein [Mesorhizobium sp. 1M-11]
MTYTQQAVSAITFAYAGDDGSTIPSKDREKLLRRTSRQQCGINHASVRTFAAPGAVAILSGQVPNPKESNAIGSSSQGLEKNAENPILTGCPPRATPL